MSSDLRVGLVGFGYWGPNLARVFNSQPDCRLVAISDRSEERRRAARLLYPDVEVSSDDRLTTADDVDVVLIATPVSTHYGLARAALADGKHVWIEKPMTASSEEARELVELAEARERVLLVDHTFLFTSAVRKMKEVIAAGELGEIYYYDSVRINLGLLQEDVNVVWDLAPHDFSIMDHLFDRAPLALSAHARGHFGTGMEDVAYVTVFYDNDLMAHFHLNWLSPVKLRRTVVGGSRRMLVWDDLNPEERIKIYQKGAEVTSREGAYGIQASYRVGDMTSPALSNVEALKAEADYFVECIREGKRPFNDGEAGLRVVSLLEASDRSIERNGEVVEL